jgi:hypothetical protein
MTDYYKDIDDPYIPPKPYGPRFEATDVRMIRDSLGCGLMEARSVLMQEQVLEDLRKGKCGLDTGLLYDILIYLIENDKIHC